MEISPRHTLTCMTVYHGITDSTKAQIANLLHPDGHDKVTVVVQPVQQQVNSVDCGVFAIAFATALCFGLNPVNIHLNRREIRKHLWQCLSNNKFTMSPNSLVNGSPGIPKKVTINIHCSCRMPYNASEQMVECDCCSKWFHQSCENIPDAFFRNAAAKKWICSVLKSTK